MTLSVRHADPADLPLIAHFIRELADYERLAHEVRFIERTLGEHLFGAHPMAEVLIGAVDGEPQGYALFVHNFSSFEGRPGVWLEDLFVREAARGQGLGTALLAALARLAVERGCARLEWSVLDWNAPSIAFYETLGARALSQWKAMRVEGEALHRLGEAYG